MHNLVYTGIIVYLIIALVFAIIFQLMEKTKGFRQGLTESGIRQEHLDFRFEILKVAMALIWPFFLAGLVFEVKKRWAAENTKENTNGTKKRNDS